MPTYTFNLHLLGVQPQVTRTFKVSSEGSMYLLHHIIQVVMRWKNYHLYQFEVDGVVYADPRLDDQYEAPITNVRDASIADVFHTVGTTAVYEYDFGDGWVHHLELVDISNHPVNEVIPHVIAGENACPPEDCGGPYGYQQLLEILNNPKHPEYKETRVWVGKTFNPEVFNIDDANNELGKLNKYIKEYEEDL